jgi:hypothetical protein
MHYLVTVAKHVPAEMYLYDFYMNLPLHVSVP